MIIEGFSPRGFAQFDGFTDTYGATVHVHESSAADGPHIWLTIDGGEIRDNKGSAHLSLEQAKRIINALTAAIVYAHGEWDESEWGISGAPSGAVVNIIR